MASSFFFFSLTNILAIYRCSFNNLTIPPRGLDAHRTKMSFQFENLYSRIPSLNPFQYVSNTSAERNSNIYKNFHCSFLLWQIVLLEVIQIRLLEIIYDKIIMISIIINSPKANLRTRRYSLITTTELKYLMNYVL